MINASVARYNAINAQIYKDVSILATFGNIGNAIEAAVKEGAFSVTYELQNRAHAKVALKNLEQEGYQVTATTVMANAVTIKSVNLLITW